MSKEFIKSAADAMKGKIDYYPSNLSASLEAGHQVAGCGYEDGTSWGIKVIWSKNVHHCFM